MQYIDSAMVGRLGSDPSAAVGLMSTSLWLFWGLCSAFTMGFSVQIAHRVGAGDYLSARVILREGIFLSFMFGLLMALTGVGISGFLPLWLGGGDSINGMAGNYFAIFTAALPFLAIGYLAAGTLRSTGNMKVPGLLYALMCVLDIVFNFFLIFPSATVNIGGMSFYLPRAGLGVEGAAIGTAVAEILIAGALLYWACFRQKEIALSLHREDKVRLRDYLPHRSVFNNTFRLASPLMLEHGVLCIAQIITTMIVAPLGNLAIAANAFAVTAEAICYMPGYGFGEAATTLTGQCVGAGRRRLGRQFTYLTVAIGVAVMGLMGVVLWIGAPAIMSLMSPVAAIQDLGVSALRIEAWAEPMFGAAIVCYGAMVGAGDTFIPPCMNFASIWLVRLPIACLLAPVYGLDGVWIGMCIELCFRGLIFLWRLAGRKWLSHKATESVAEEDEHDMLPGQDSM